MILSTSDDKFLLAQINKGNIEAFNAYYKKYVKLVKVAAYNCTKSIESAEDIVQTIFISIWKRRETITIEESKSYLYRAVQFESYELFRKNKIQEKRKYDNYIKFTQKEGVEDKSLYNKELRLVFESVIKKIPSKRNRISFIMFHLQNKGTHEIALETNQTIENVRMQVSRAVKFLRKELEFFRYA